MAVLQLGTVTTACGSRFSPRAYLGRTWRVQFVGNNLPGQEPSLVQS